MLKSLCLSAAMAVGQFGGADPPAGRVPVLPRFSVVAPAQGPAPAATAQAEKPPEPLDVQVIVPPAPTPAEEAAEAAEEEAAPDRWFFMRQAQGTWIGYLLDGHRTSLSGWTEFSYTVGDASVTNLPVVWNDRANEFLVNQHWTRLERSVVTSDTTQPSWGYRMDWLYGTDYRFTLMRGLWNSQLANDDGTQNLYGVDPIQFYANVYVPTWFQGVDLRVGRLFTPFGYESLEGISTPFKSRSYAFNWCPPFTHIGMMATVTLSPQWTVKAMFANGNDVFFDPAQEPRFVGAVTWTSPSKADTVTFGTSVGRGKFNAGQPFNPATVGLNTEPAGRNNINVFDLVWIHTFNPQFSYGFEVIYGYQTSVPANVAGGIIALDKAEGTAHWGSVVQYLTWNLTDKLAAITRFELFDDFEGQRTGFEGLYTAITLGCAYKPLKSLWFRPEVRYDYNGYSKPFEGGEHGLFTATIDTIVRW